MNFANDIAWDPNLIGSLLEKYDVDYIVLSANAVNPADYLVKHGWGVFRQSGNYWLYGRKASGEKNGDAVATF